jgi:hypothetical protein
MSLPILIAQHNLDSDASLKSLICVLTDMTIVTPYIEEAMKFIFDWRSKYIQDHLSDFPTEKSKKDYIRAWIANYEISDYLKSKSPLANILFLRYNETPEYDHATHEEKDRMKEQFPFGGKKGQKSDQSSFGPNDSMMIVEKFTPERKLLRPEDAITDPNIRKFRAAVIDVNGHFVTCVPYHDSDGKKVIIFNTMQSSVLQQSTTALAFDLID